MPDPMRPQSSLPADVMDIIFGFFTASVNLDTAPEAERRRAQACLASCALVCRVWQETAKRHLFKYLKCTLRVEIPRPDHNHPGNAKLDSLKDFLTSSPNISSSVRRLELDMSVTRLRLSATSGYFGSRDPESCPVRLHKILHLLPRLTDVKLCNICPFMFPSALPDRLCLPALPKLDSLHIDYSRRIDNVVLLHKITDILSLFAEVRHFELEDVEIVEEDPFTKYSDMPFEELPDLHGRNQIPERCRFQSIRFHNVRNASPLLEAFAKLPSIRSLQSLQLGCMFSGGSSGLTKLIRAVATNLKHLQFGVECTPTVDTLNLTRCTNLTSLTITFPIIVTSFSSSLEAAKVPYLVPNHLPNFLSFAPHTLRSVVFLLHPVVGWSSRGLNDFGQTLLPIEAALTQLVEHKGLETVVFSNDQGRKFPPDDEEYLSTLLSTIRKRGVLRLG